MIKKLKRGTLAIVPFLCQAIFQIGCSSPPKSENGSGSEDKSITSNSDAIPMTAPVEIATELNQIVKDDPITNHAPEKGEAYRKAASKLPGAKEADSAVVQAANDEKKTEEDSNDANSNDENGKPIHGKNHGKGKPHVMIYVVKTGDTLMKISFSAFGDLTRWKEIYNDNKPVIPNPNVLTRGTQLKINVFDEVEVMRNGEPYAIKRGDTLGKISNWIYGTFAKWRVLWHNNEQLIHDPNKIYAGFKLYYVKDPAKAEQPKALTTAPAAPVAPAAEPARNVATE